MQKKPLKNKKNIIFTFYMREALLIGGMKESNSI